MKTTDFTALAGACLLAVALTGCDARAQNEAERDAERAGENVEEAARKAGDKIEGAAEEAGDALQRAGEKAEPAVEEAGRTLDAGRQTVEIKAALLADDDIDGSEIDVDTDAATKTVTLKGTVATASQKAAAERIAKSKAEGYAVKNMLVVAAN